MADRALACLHRSLCTGATSASGALRNWRCPHPFPDSKAKLPHEANAGTGEDDYGDRMQALLREQRECDDAGKNRDASDERPI